MIQDHFRLLGGPGSPYSLKLRAILRYRRIPHIWLVPRGYLGTAGELAAAGKKMVPVLQYPEGVYRADSTPIAFDLEARFPGMRSILPEDPVQAFLSYLIEDMADELLVQAMFDLRWRPGEDQLFCARRQISGWVSPCPSGQFEGLVQQFLERQRAQRARMVQADHASTHALRLMVYEQVMAVIEAMLSERLFLFGSRPSLADFGLFGQLSQCAIDPSAAAMMRGQAPRCFQWVQMLDDASGIDGDWMAPLQPGQPDAALSRLLDVVGTVYLPYLVGNAQAVTRGERQLEMMIAGQAWSSHASAYKRNCLTWLRRAVAAFEGTDRQRLKDLLEPHQAWAALQPDHLVDEGVPVMAPA